MESFAWCKRFRGNPSVSATHCQLPFQGSQIKPPLKGEGDRRRRWRGSVWNLLLGVKDLRNNPSVSLRLPAPLSGELDETSPERGGGPSSDGGGVLCEIFCLV